MTDVLADVLELMRIRTTLYALARLPRAWGVAFPATQGAYFHVLDGTGGWLSVAGDTEPRQLRAGDVLLLAHGSDHRLSYARHGGIRVTFDADRWRPNERVTAGDPGDPDSVAPTLVCGKVAMRSGLANPLLGALPDVVHLRSTDPARADLGETLELIDRQHAWTGPGSGVLLARLGDVLLIQILRAWLAHTPPGDRGWVAALRDPQIGAALAAIHASPGRAWSVASLAEEAALSRSRFAERFTAVVGEPPLSYLGRWRMTRAADLLTTTDRTINDVATAVGYRSEAAFTRAFTRHYGTSPRRFAQSHRIWEPR